MDERRSETNFRLLEDYEPSRMRGRTWANLNEGAHHIEAHFSYNKTIFIILLLRSILKVGFSAYGLLFEPIECDLSLQKWLIVMLIHDVIAIYQLMSTMLLVRKIRQFNQDYAARRNDLEAGNIRNFCREVISMKQKIDYWSLWGSRLYILLFLFAQIIYFAETTCDVEAPYNYKLALFFINLQFLSFCAPFLLVLGLAFCFPCLSFFLNMIPGQSEVEPADKRSLDELKVEKYHKEEQSETTECGICLCEYENNDEIIKLPCSGKHQFHATCIKQWLSVNRICPLCRARVA